MGENKSYRTLLAVVRSPEFGLLASIGLLVGLIYFLAPRDSFFTKPAMLSLLRQIGLYGVLAVGAAVVIISGGIDLSVGAMVALSSVVCAKLMTSWLHDGSSGVPPSNFIIVASMAISVLMGLFIGLFHAFLINHFGLPPFIATLATMSGLRSLASILAGNQSITLNFPLFRKLGGSEENTFATFAVVAIVVSLMMGCTVLGRHLFALGGNEAAARLSGLKINRLKAFAYGLSGALAALAGLLFAGKGGQAGPELGISYELFAITSAVVGGCSLAGGVGSIRGTVLGLILIQTLIKGTGLVVRKIDFFLGKTHVEIPLNSTQVEGLILGTVIILAVAINQRLRPKL
jgi:ribose/xylose/arabinose/galactoside ABC-type transport system permease subunit